MKLSNARLLFLFTAFTAGAIPAFSQAKNAILFVGDGGGVTPLNAASIYGYGKAQALYIQSMPNVALADSSTAKQWVTDGAGAASAMATGRKGSNGVLSMSPEAEKDVKDGEVYKTVLEYAEERGLSTGLITNEKDGIAYAAISAFYAHSNNRGRSLDIFHQFLKPRFGNGPDVVIVPTSKKLNAEAEAAGEDVHSRLKEKGYTLVSSMPELAALDSRNARLVAMFEDDTFDMTQAVQLAVARLSKNPRGFFLVVHSDCHLGKTRASLNRLIELDKAIRAVPANVKSDTLLIYTADHGYALHLKGENTTETQKAADHKLILYGISLEDEHTAEEVPVVAMGPGSERVKGFISNTDVFRVMMSAFGWNLASTN
jgi:alkaline phosphatase